MQIRRTALVLVAAAALALGTVGLPAQAAEVSADPGPASTAQPSAASPHAVAVTDYATATRYSATTVQPAKLTRALDHCTGFCTSIYNGLSRSVYMGGNDAADWVPSGAWSDEAVSGLADVDWLFVPDGCDLYFRGKHYNSGDFVRIHGWSPYVWLIGTC